MKKLLLSMAFAAAALIPASAADYEFYVATKAENNQVTDYALVQEGYDYVVSPELHDITLECALFIKVKNNTDAAQECVVDVEQVYDKNEFGDANVLWQTCLGTICQTGQVRAFVAANSETPGGTGEHIGYTMICFDPSMAEAVKFDAKYNVTMTMGSEVRHFTVTYSSNPAGVESVGVASGEAEYFNMQGLRVSVPEKGQMYIVRQGGKVSKTIVR